MHRGNRSSFASRAAQPARFKNGFKVQDLIRPKDIFALIVASIGHDVGHPGVNNVFLVSCICEAGVILRACRVKIMAAC